MHWRRKMNSEFYKLGFDNTLLFYKRGSEIDIDKWYCLDVSDFSYSSYLRSVRNGLGNGSGFLKFNGNRSIKPNHCWVEIPNSTLHLKLNHSHFIINVEDYIDFIYTGWYVSEFIYLPHFYSHMVADSEDVIGILFIYCVVNTNICPITLHCFHSQFIDKEVDKGNKNSVFSKSKSSSDLCPYIICKAVHLV